MKILVKILCICLSLNFIFSYYVDSIYVKDGNEYKITRGYYQDGNIEYETSFKNFQGDLGGWFFRKHGRCVIYWENGNLKVERYYKNSKKHGTSKTFYSNGNLEKQITYKNDKFDGKKIFKYENGNIKEESVYKDGSLVSNHITYDENGDVKHIKKPQEEIILRTHVYLGPRVLSLGDDDRVREIYTYTKKDGLVGEYVRDKVKENNFFLEKYNNSILTEDELELFYFEDMDIILTGGKIPGGPDRDLYKKLIDFYYYGKKLGKIKEINDVLNKVHPSLKTTILEHIDPYVQVNN